MRSAWAKTQSRCACCWKSSGRKNVHHILGSARRIDDVANLLILCPACHELVHASKISLGVILSLKLESDPDHWSHAWLEENCVHRLPDAQPIPYAIHQRRRKYEATEGTP